MRYAIKEIIPLWMLRGSLSQDTVLREVRQSMTYQLAKALMENFGNKPLQHDECTGEQFLMFELSIEEESQIDRIAADAERDGYRRGRAAVMSTLPWGFDEVYE